MLDRESTISSHREQKHVNDSDRATARGWLRAAWPALAAIALLAQGAVVAGNFYLDDYYYLHLARAGAAPWALLVADQWFGVYFRPGFFPLFWLCHAVFGAHAWGYLAVNLALVVGTTGLLFAALRRWLDDGRVAFWAAALFAALPSTTMGAHFVFNMPDTLGTFLFVLSLWALARAQGGRKGLWLTVSLVAAGWAMLCKENQITIVAAVALGWWLRQWREGLRGWALAKTVSATVWPYAAIAAGYLAWRTAMLGGLGGYQQLGAGGIDGRLLPVFAQLLGSYFVVLPVALGIAAALALALAVTGWGTRAPRLAAWGAGLLVATTAPMALNLLTPVMALWFPLRFFYLSGLGVAVVLASAAALRGRRRIAAQVVLAALVALATVNSAKLAWDFSQWQQRRAASLRAVGGTIVRDHGDAPVGTVFYYCARPNDHALDSGAKFYHPELIDRYLILHCNDRTEFVADQAVLAATDVDVYFDPLLRRNPVAFGDLRYGIAGANLRKVQRDDRRSDLVRVVVPPDEIDELGDRFFPLARFRDIKPAGY